MNDTELFNIWQSYDRKLDKVLRVNEQVTFDLLKGKLDKSIGKMKRPKRLMLAIGIPYTILLYFITGIAWKAGAVFVFLGFGAIALIMAAVVVSYFYHLHLIHEINHSDDVVEVQEAMSKLEIASFNSIRLSILQIPFWSLCWVSLDALRQSWLIYGGINLAVFLGLAYLAYWLYKELDIRHPSSKVSRFFLSGSEWDPILKSTEILEQLKAYNA